MKKENCNGKIIIKISIIWIFILAIIIAFLIAFFRNYILATNETSSDAQLDEEKIQKMLKIKLPKWESSLEKFIKSEKFQIR